MQREGAIPDRFVQNKMTRIASLDYSTKHLELLARRGGKWCLHFAVWLWRSFIQHHQIATDSAAIEYLVLLASVRIRPFCGTGPASPAFRLVDPHALPLPFLPTATSSLLTTTPPAPLSLFNNKSMPSS
jgi:hypothetical protein